MPIKAPDNWFRGPVQVGVRRGPVQPVVVNNVRAGDQIIVQARRDPEMIPLNVRNDAQFFREERERIKAWFDAQPARIRPVAQPMRHPDMPQPPQGVFKYVGKPITWTFGPFDDGREITKEDIV